MKIRKQFLGSRIVYNRKTSRAGFDVYVEDTPEFIALAKEMGWDYLFVKERKKKADEPESDQEGND